MSNERFVSRREFLAALAAVPIAAPLAAPALLRLSRKTDRAVTGGFMDDGSAAGHALRDGSSLGRAREQRTTRVAIVGGGMGGLSAAWQLDRQGVPDWLLLEMATATGGNARSGTRQGQRYPWGAHYVPVPDEEAVHVRALFRDLGVLADDGTWDERTLAHSPQERLWQHGRWRDGLDPTDALPTAERAQFARFEQIIQEWRATGAFRVPSAQGHAARAGTVHDARVRALDAQTAAQWMTSQQFTSPALRWWVEHGTRDDYGASLQQASAWAAVHYFAARAPDEQGPLTWPEGNDWIAQQLTRRLEARVATDGGARIVTGAPAVRIERAGAQWLVRTPRVDVRCDVIIWSAPLFVLPYVLPTVSLPVRIEYAPWVVANVSLDREPERHGVPEAWDNVVYGSSSLGYVSATHQLLSTPAPSRVYTWYHAMVDRSARDARQQLQQISWSQWRDHILADLARAHPDIRDCVTHIDVMRWGHAMARPVPGVLSRVERLERWQPAPGVFIAHADMSGISLFEEAQWHGIKAADNATRMLTGATG